MENKSQELRPYLKMEADGSIEVVMRPYYGPVPLWMFAYFNERVCYHAERNRLKGDSPYDIRDCYQKALNDDALVDFYIKAIVIGIDKKGNKIEDPKAYIQYCIQTLCNHYFNEINDANDHVSLDVEVHGNKALTQDKPYDEQGKDSSTVIARTLAKLTEPERKLFTEFMKSKTKDEAISKTEIPHATFFRKFDQACFHFLGNLGLEKVRPLIHDLNKRIVLDVLIWSKGDIPVAAEMLGKTYKDCRAAFKDLIPVLLRACGGIDGLMACCL